MRPDEFVVRAEGLTRRFTGPDGRPRVALDRVSLSVTRGQLTALVGPDGAGKTTLMRMMAGLLAPDEGSLRVLGLDVTRDAQAVQDRISYMPQRFGLYEDLSVQENLDLYADLHGVPQAVRRERFARLMAMTDLARFTARPAGKLSGGMKQKLGLACTLVRSPELLLLAALSVAREREQGTFDQLLVTPLTPMQILVGKAVPSVMVGLMQSTIILLIIRFWFQIPMAGSIVTLYLGLLVFTVAAVGVGLSLSALSLTMQQAMLYTFLVVMPLMMLSGMLTPVRNMPELLQVATYANPLRFGVAIARGVYLEGATLVDIVPHLIPLSVMIAVTLPLAAWLFRHRLG